MQISQLKQFISIAANGSMSKAAQELNISQPALTVSIRQLEEELGTPLFIRSSKGVSLTNYGRSIYQSVIRIMDELDAIKPSAPANKLISICMLKVSNRISELVAAYAALHPEIRFHIECRTFGEDVQARYHFYVADHLPDERNQYTSILLPTQKLYALIPAGHPLATRKFINPYELKDEAFVFSAGQGGHNFEPSYYVCTESGFSPRIAVTTDSLHQKISLLSTGRFCSIVTGSWVDVYKHIPDIRLIPLTGCTYSMRNIALYYTDQTQQNRKAADFLAFCLSHLDGIK